jgi:hypothetical protein
MKKNGLVTVDNQEEILSHWTAEVELGQVRYSAGPEVEVDFFNHIDAWRKMEISFKHKMERPLVKREKKEFSTLYYSFRENLS